MAKRTNGEGSIRKRGNKYQGRITVLENDIPRTIAFTRATRAEVAAELREIINRVEVGKPAVDSTMTVARWVKAWTDGPLKASNRRVTTQDQYRQLLNRHVVPALGEVKLAKLKPTMVEGLLAGLRESRSASTTRSTYAAFRACMDTAVRDGLIAANPVSAVDRPRASRPAARTLTVDHVKALVVQARSTQDCRIEHLIVLLAATGLRRSEALGLRWVDVDFDTAQLEVSGALVRDSEGLRRGQPKSAAGLRHFSLAPLAADALKRQRRKQREQRLRAGSAWINSGYVFTTPVGGAMEPRNVSREYAELAQRAGLPDTGMHALRHYAATAWLASGKATVRDVADALGHSSPTITLEIYTSAIPEAQTAAINAAAAALDL